MRVSELRDLIAKLGPDTLVVLSNPDDIFYRPVMQHELTRDEGMFILYAGQVEDEPLDKGEQQFEADMHAMNSLPELRSYAPDPRD